MRDQLVTVRTEINSESLQLAVVILGLWISFANNAGGQEPEMKSAQEYAHTFKGQAKQALAFDLWGPDAEKCVKYEPDGLRLTLPTGDPKNGPYVGVNANVAVEGDFEITVSYEILKEPAKSDGVHPAVKLVLMGVVDTPEWSPVVLGRIIGADGESYYTMWRTLGDTKGKQLATQAKSGQLRMKRTGTVISYHAAEGPAADFQFLHEFPFTDRKLKQIRILGAVGGPNSFLDARVTDLRIRARSLPNLPSVPVAVAPLPQAAPQPQAAPEPAEPLEPPGSKAWLMAGLLIGMLVIFALTAAVGAGLYMRQRRQIAATAACAVGPSEQADEDAASASISLRCPGCGTKITAKPALADKKIKCPQCGKAVLVPSIQASKAQDAS